MTDIVERLRGLEDDHEPDGWPAIRMRDVSALLDELKLLRSEIDALVLDASVLAEYGGDGGRPEWWLGGTWLYPGDRVVLLPAPTASRTTGTEPGAEGA